MSNHFNALWLTKVSLVESSQRECSKWGMDFVPVLGTSDEKAAMIQLVKDLPMPQRYIMNYEGLNNENLLNLLKTIRFDAIIVDEVHRLKGGASYSPTKIWKNAKVLIRHHVEHNNAFPFFLTGSLINNKISEIWAYLHIFDPERFPRLRDFESVFNPAYLQGIGLVPTELIKLLSPNMVRRRKDEVGIELPPKNYMEPELLSLDDNPTLKKIYQGIQNELMVMLDSMPEDAPLTVRSVLSQLHYLRAVLVAPGRMNYNYYPLDPETLERAEFPIKRTLEFPEPYVKLDAVADTAFELFMQGERSVIFSAQYNKPLQHIHKRLIDCGIKSEMIVGGSPVSAIERRFQQGETDVLVCNLKAAAEGLNLHRCDEWPGGASHVLFLDRWWNPELNRQGEDRTYRIGTNKPVFIHKFYFNHTVDLFIRDIEERKAADAASITESTAFRAGEWKTMIGQYLA